MEREREREERKKRNGERKSEENKAAEWRCARCGGGLLVCVSHISPAVEDGSLAAGTSGSVLTKRCLFPGLQGSLGPLGTEGGAKQREATGWHTGAAALPMHLSFPLNRSPFLFLGRGMEKMKPAFFPPETGPRDNKTVVVVSNVFLFLFFPPLV